MQKKKIATLGLAFVILVSVGLYFVFFRLNKKSSAENQNIKTAQTETISIEDEKITDNTAPFKIDITYPKIAGQEEFNTLVKNIVDKQISDFKTNSLENDTAVKETDPVTYAKYPREYDLIISYDKGEVDTNLASVVLNIYYFEGGAHGMTIQTAVNYDFKNKKEIVLADIYAGQENYVQKISDYCITDLTKQITEAMGSDSAQYMDKNAIELGAGPTAENFNIFLINKENITFYFPQYQVAAGYLGGFKVVMPR